MKKSILMLFGVGDVFCDEASHRCIKRGSVIADKAMDILERSKHDFFGVVRVNEPSDTFRKIDVKDKVSNTRVIDVKLCSGSVFDSNNQITVPGIGGDHVLDGDQLDHILPPEKYDIYIAGIDINGVFIDLMGELQDRGYNATVFSDIIKPFSKATIETIKSSRVRFGKS